MKKNPYNNESLVSVALTDYAGMDIPALSATLSRQFAYYEILIVTDAGNGQDDGLESQLTDCSNVRVMLLNDRYQREVLEEVVLEQAIGDFVIFFEPGTDPECIPQIADAILDGADFVGMRYDDPGFFSTYAMMSWIYCAMIYLLTGTRIPTNLSNTIGVSRNLISAIMENHVPHRYLKLMNAQFSYKTTILLGGGKRPRATLKQLWDRMAFGVDVLSSASPRLIKFASILALFFAMLNGAYIFYVLGVYLFKANVQEGWATMSLVMASMFCVLFFVLAVIGVTCGNIMRQKSQIPRYGVVNEFTSSGVISTMTRMNVETGTDCKAPGGDE